MGRRREKDPKRSQTLPPSPSHSFSSSSSSDFEFTISISPRKSSSTLCPADDLFYKGQLLPLHLSPRISMVRTLLLASSSTSSSSDTTTTASRDSTGSSGSNETNSSFSSDLVSLADCDSSRPSSVTEDDEFRKLNNHNQGHSCQFNNQIKKNKYFSLARFSSVFKKEPKSRVVENVSGNSVKRMSTTAKEVIRKYLKKVKPLYEKLSQKQQQQQQQKMGGVGGGGITANSNTTSSSTTPTCILFSMKTDRSVRDQTLEESTAENKNSRKENITGLGFSHSFSGNLRYPRRRSCVSSCPSSMRSSPSHSGMLSRSGNSGSGFTRGTGGSGGLHHSDSSTMEELQSAIQGAIAHCKNSMNKGLVCHEI